ncbi:MAG: hypothetical protein RIS75_1137 [Actinomycetota bacterium]|jgi:RimJ/RimL family protein N-acetyltransferase
MPYPLLTKRLLLEPLKRTDLETFVEYRRDHSIAQFQGWDSNYSMAQAVELLESQIDIKFPDKGKWLQIGVHLCDSGELIGDLAIHHVENSENEIEIGFTIAAQHQQKGYATEAISELITFLQKEHGTTTFIAHTDSRNTASMNLLNSLGFKEHPEENFVEDFKGEQVYVVCFRK